MPESSSDKDARLRAEALMRGQLDPEAQQRLFDPNQIGSNITPSRDIQAVAKTISDMALEMQGISRAMLDQQSMLKTTATLQQQTTDSLREQKELTDAKNAAQAKINDLQGKDLANRLKQLELTKQEEQVVGKIRKGQQESQLSQADQRTLRRLRSAFAASSALEQTGLTPGQATRLGVINDEDAAVLAGGPERARRLFGTRFGGRFGIATTEGLGGAVRSVAGNPYIEAALAGIAMFHGAEGMESGGAAGFLSSIPVIGGTLAGIANQIPGLQALSAFGNTTRLGMVTGDGYRAGLGAQWRAFRMGANPFDIVSQQTAAEIIGSARAQGFRGARERAFTGSMMDIYKQTGLPIQQLAEIGTLFAKNNGLDQFRATMESVDNIARDSSQSVASVATQIQTLSQALSGTGTAPLGLAGAIVKAVSTVAPNLTPEQQQSLTTGFFGQAGLERFSGYPGATATAPSAIATARTNQRLFLNSMRANYLAATPNMRAIMLDNLVNQGVFGSAAEARQAIMHGNTILNRLQTNMRQGQADRAFAAAQIASDRVKKNPSFLGSMMHKAIYGVDVAGVNIPDPFLPGVGNILHAFGLGHHDARPEETAYLLALHHSLRGTHLTQQQISKITSPLSKTLSGHSVMLEGRQQKLSWDQALKLSQDRAREYTLHRNAKGTLMIQLDAGETKRLLSGKNVSKAVQFGHAVEGAAKYVGTSFWEGVG
jgi:hypothetical protein